MVIRWRNDRGRGQENQDAPGRCVVQARPRHFDLLQLAQALCAEVPNDEFVAGVGRVRSELTVQLPPSEP